MNRHELDKLLARYYEGNTSCKEEELLIEILSSEQLSPEYMADREILLGLKGSDNIPEPSSGFEAGIMAAIDKSEKETRIVSLKRRVYSAIAVAASVLIVASSYFLLRTDKPQDTFSDPALAYNATLEVLHKVGSTLNSGTDVISELSIISETEDNLNLLSEPTRMAAKEMQGLKHIRRSIDILDIGSGN